MTTMCMHVKNSLDEIKKFIKKKKLNELDSDTLKLLQYLQIELTEIKEHGISMENRLSEYRMSIEILGFKRDKKRFK